MPTEEIAHVYTFVNTFILAQRCCGTLKNNAHCIVVVHRRHVAINSTSGYMGPCLPVSTLLRSFGYHCNTYCVMYDILGNNNHGG